jgi:AraC-like DNA-binding protein
MELAAQYVTLGSMSGQEIADLLGYSRPSAFFRAFKDWFGVTPGQFRATHTTSPPRRPSPSS